MKFVCLGYYNLAMTEQPASEIQKILEACRPQLNELYQTGRIFLDSGLEPSKKSICTRDGKLLVSDGPFAETKEILGGIFVVEAENLQEAIHIASKHPAARSGQAFGWRIDVHPTHDFKQLDQS